MATLIASTRTSSPTTVAAARPVTPPPPLPAVAVQSITPPTVAQILAAQISIQNLPSPPKDTPALKLNASRNTRTQNAFTSTQAQLARNNLGSVRSNPTPPPTPGTTSSPNPTLLQPIKFGIPKGTLTPQTTGTTSPKSVTGPGAILSAQAVTACGPRSTLSRELRGAVLDLCMDVDKQVEEKWESKVRSQIDALVNGVVRNSLKHEQEIMHAARVRPWPIGTGKKLPSIVVSVADSKDRKAVKKMLKQHPWLQDEISECGLRLMVVEDPAKLQSKGRLAEPNPATSLYKATLSTGSTAWTYCGATLTSHPESKMAPAALALGGTVIIDDAIYGLTAGHAFFESGVGKLDTSSSEADTSSSESDKDLDQWLDDPSNPFVFKEDDDSFQDASTLTDVPTPISADSFSEKASQILPDPPMVKQLKSMRSYDVAVLTPSIAPSHRVENVLHRRNCDWALVELPPDIPIPPNRYLKSTEEVLISGAVANGARPSGLVQVVLPGSQILEGHLRANAASYRVGTCLFDVRLIYLDEMLPTACSGAWVIHDHSVCGYIIAARLDARSVYMLPIQSVLQDIRDTLGAKEVFIPVQDESTQQRHTILRPGRLSDIIAKEKSDLAGQGEQFQDPLTQQERDAVRSTVQGNYSHPEAQGTHLTGAIDDLPQLPKPVHQRRPQFPGKKGSSFSVTPRELRSEPRQNLEPSSSTDEQISGSVALTRSSNKGTIGGQNINGDFTDQVVKALQLAALIACWPCLYPLRRRRRRQKADLEHTTLSITAEKSQIVIEPILSPVPMFYEIPREMVGHSRVREPKIDSGPTPPQTWTGTTYMSDPEAEMPAMQRDAPRLWRQSSFSPSWHDEAPTPASEAEEPLPFHFVRRGKGRDEDGDSISIILSPEDREAEIRTPSQSLDRISLDQTLSIHGTGYHFDGSLKASRHGRSTMNETNHKFSRSETDLRESTVPGILSKNAFQSWAHSPPFTSTIAYAHTAISA